MRLALTLAICCCLTLGVGAPAREAQAPAITTAATEFFEGRIRPVLAEHCFKCHGPTRQESGLRLDSRSAVLKGGDHGAVVKPGDPDHSRLIQAVRQTGKLKMPWKEKRLSPQAVADLTAWVKMGLPWPPSNTSGSGDTTAEPGERHWAFKPVTHPQPPEVKDRDWPRNAVDRFVLAKLEAKGLRPAPAADRRTLLRRVTFDLIGPPPTPEEVAAFEADQSPDAYARVVERLLASPHYGERWGRYWLDVSRYADTKGYVFFEEANYPWAWTYRDYVIRAFNEDLPYDQFVLQQLAADQLPLGRDRRPLAAMGFVTCGGHFMSNPHDIIDDRIDVITRGLLGLTVTCARCHDHKFDPIPTRDYYSLYGVLASSIEPDEPPLFADPPATPAYAAFDKELKSRQHKLAEFVRTKQHEVFTSAKTRVAEYLMAAHGLRDKPNTSEFMIIADGGDLNPAMLIRWQAYLARTRKKHHPVFAPWHALVSLPDDREFEKAAAQVAGKFLASQDRKRPVNTLVVGSFVEKPPKTLSEAAQRYGALLNETEKQWQDALKRAADQKLPAPTSLADPEREALRQVFHGPDAAPNVPPGLFNDLDLLPDRPSQAKFQELRKGVEQWRATGPGAPPRAMTLVDAPKPYEPRVFLRGNPNNLGPAVPRQFLGVLSGPKRRAFQHGSGRLELARAIVDRQNPLTARVLVNRLWMHHFGAGLARTPSDFGTRSEPPTHPRLLDHLASTFMENGWSIKKMQRLMVLSAAYQQKSEDRLECRRVDPENALLWKLNRRRLDFEATRDALLAVSGRLDRRVGGPPVKDILAASSNRRTVYGFIDRQNVPGLYRTFDFPSPDASSPRRDVTTVPQQALFLMNNPFVIDCARKLLQRPEIVGAIVVGRRVGLLYRLLYGRGPTIKELRMAGEFLDRGMLARGAWEQYAQALLVVNEFAFVD
jgi:hypothetical protein